MNPPTFQSQIRREAPIAAIATAPGKGGIGIVRVSGIGIEAVIQGLVAKSLKARQATRARFLDASGAAIDEGIVIFFPAPHSFTGEDVLELQGHGGPVVLQMLLRRCVELGAHLAQPGEFTRRAFLNGKLDLAQAEAVADLIEAASDVGVRCALRSLQGEFSNIINKLSAKIIDLRMLVEAVLDFPEEDIDAADKLQIEIRLAGILAAVREALAQGRRGSVLRTGISVVIAGRPNMGKSSLLNALAGDDVAIVAPIPGTTRDAVRQAIQIEGIPINIIDTAGLRDSDDEVEKLGMERTWRQVNQADTALLVIEDAAGITREDQAIVEQLPRNVPCIVVRNKIDVSGAPVARIENEGKVTLCLSAKTGAGLENLRAELLRLAGWQTGEEDVFLARARHLEALEHAALALEEAQRERARLEIFAEELRQAHVALSSITGKFTADDLLGEIFSRFCIGK